MFGKPCGQICRGHLANFSTSWLRQHCVYLSLVCRGKENDWETINKVVFAFRGSSKKGTEASIFNTLIYIKSFAVILSWTGYADLKHGESSAGISGLAARENRKSLVIFCKQEPRAGGGLFWRQRVTWLRILKRCKLNAIRIYCGLWVAPD